MCRVMEGKEGAEKTADKDGPAGGAGSSSVACVEPTSSLPLNCQGMKTPLVAKKQDGATGVIVNAAERQMTRGPPPPPPMPAPPAAAGASNASKGAVTFRGRPSRVLLLKNMVGPGEVRWWRRALHA